MRPNDFQTSIFARALMRKARHAALSSGARLPSPDEKNGLRMDIAHYVAEIVTAYVSRNNVEADKLADVIESVRCTLAGLCISNSGHGPHGHMHGETGAVARPAVPVRSSVHSDHLVCLEDGKKMRSLKRHLLAAHGLSPEQYVTRWNLPHDYPMVAPNYSILRSQLAKTSGLGKSEPRRKGRTSRTCD